MAINLREKEEEYRAINQQLQLKTQQLLEEANQVIVSKILYLYLSIFKIKHY